MGAEHHIIKEAGETMGQLLQASFARIGYKRVHLVVAAPTKESVEGKLPALGLYLHGVTIDEEGLGNNLGAVYVDRVVDNKGVAREVQKRMPLWVRLDYLVTTWAQTPEEEALLMGVAIKTLVENPTVSGPLLKGDSFEEGDYLPVHLSQKLDEAIMSRFWSSISQPMKPAVQFWTTVPIFPADEKEIRRVEERDVRFFDLSKVKR